MHRLLLIFTVGVLALALPVNAQAQGQPNDPIVVLVTTQGDITIRLFKDVAPKAVENFVRLCQSGYYNGTVFHRVIKEFMIQGGDPTGTGRAGESIWKQPFEDEVSEFLNFNKPGLLAMANAGPNTNGSQFFITVKEAPWLHMKHTIFGEVIEGMEVVTAIENVETGEGDKPIVDQMILAAKVTKSK
jgi:peptidylprolyl isomerase